MFSLHDRVKRRIAVAGFLVMCVAPTLGVLLWSAAWRSSWHTRGEAVRLGRYLGMNAALDRVEHPLPGVARYHGLVLVSPETGREVFRCGWLETQLKTLTDAEGRPRSTLLLWAWQPQVEAAEAAEIGQMLQRAIRLRAGNAELDVQWSANRVELQTPGGCHELVDVHGGVQTTAGGTQAILRFRPAGQTEGPGVRVRLGRNRQTEPAGDWFDVNTGDAELPCEVLALGIAPIGSLGPETTFRGSLWAALAADGWQGEIEAAQFSDVDLDRIVTDRFAHRLSGTARVAIDYARFRRGRMEAIRGGIVAGPGQVSQSLLAAAVEQLGFESGLPPIGASKAVSYRQLALGFSAGPSGLVIDGRCDGPGAGAVIRDEHGRLLGPPCRSQPMVALLRTLAPPTAPEAPISPATDWLSRHLPLSNR